MFGLYRYILAMMVVFAHAIPILPSSPNAAGAYAVFSFYILSGYLMTLVLNERYGFNWQGLQKYFINRALRIYPPYLIVLILTILSLLWLKSFTIHPHIKIPTTLLEWAINLTMFNMRITDNIRVVPSAWSLFIEITYYIGMGILSKRRIAYLWFSGSVIFTVILIYSETDWGYRYFSIPGPSIAFSTGAIVYHLKARLKPFYIFPIILLIIGNFIYWTMTGWWDGIFMYGFYIHIILSASLLFSIKTIKAPAWDKKIGNLSYPIFLCHWLIIGLFSTWIESMNKGLWLFIGILPFVNLLGWMIYVVVEVRINRIREMLRPNQMIDLTARE